MPQGLLILSKHRSLAQPRSLTQHPSYHQVSSKMWVTAFGQQAPINIELMETM